MPADYILLTVEIGSEFLHVSLSKPAHDLDRDEARHIGDGHFKGNMFVPLRVTSVVASNGFNFLLSREYAEQRAKILTIEPAWLDPRLWT